MGRWLLKKGFISEKRTGNIFDRPLNRYNSDKEFISEPAYLVCCYSVVKDYANRNCQSELLRTRRPIKKKSNDRVALPRWPARER